MGPCAFSRRCAMLQSGRSVTLLSTTAGRAASYRCTHWQEVETRGFQQGDELVMPLPRKLPAGGRGMGAKSRFGNRDGSAPGHTPTFLCPGIVSHSMHPHSGTGQPVLLSWPRVQLLILRARPKGCVHRPYLPCPLYTHMS